MKTVAQKESKSILEIQQTLEAVQKENVLLRAEVALLTTQLTRKSFDILKNNNQHQGE